MSNKSLQRNWKDRYSTSQDDLIHDFYIPALQASTQYDRATGYFRSTLFSLVQGAIEHFALRGGRIRLITTPELLPEDIEAIRKGVQLKKICGQATLREIERISQKPFGEHRLRLLANMVAAGHLELRFVANEQNKGIFHDKLGIFADENHRISFTGSINETWAGWHPNGNHESFEVFTSWEGEARRVSDHQNYFDKLWESQIGGFITLTPDSDFLDNVVKRADPNPHEFIERNASSNGSHPKVLFDHQRNVLSDWRKNGWRGIVKHATGSGKTITAIEAIREHIFLGKCTLVIVPSDVLLNQWSSELDIELAPQEPAILLCGAGNTRWKNGLLRSYIRNDGVPRIVVSTIDTAASRTFLRDISSAEDLLLVIDEVHTAGSSRRSSVLTIDAKKRLGLSATPERFGDPAGTEKILDYFGKVLDPEFTLSDAIAAKRLAPYTYYPQVVRLDEEEEEAWQAYTKEIGRLWARLSKKEDNCLRQRIERLLIERSRIAKLCRSKVPMAADIVVRRFQAGQHWLVYCQQKTQLYELRDQLYEMGVESLAYFSDMDGDKRATLERFATQGGVLVSIGCLDEGVDIPEISHACILASSRNPRQFVQRRGRVLRKHDKKHHAELHDLIVIPRRLGEEAVFDGLVYGELARAVEFSHDAMNSSANVKLRMLCAELGMDVTDVAGSGTEAERD